VVLTNGSCATGTYEPGQIRNEAAISSHSCVPRGSLFRANYLGNVKVCYDKAGCAYIVKNH